MESKFIRLEVYSEVTKHNGISHYDTVEKAGMVAYVNVSHITAVEVLGDCSYVHVLGADRPYQADTKDVMQKLRRFC